MAEEVVVYLAYSFIAFVAGTLASEILASLNIISRPEAPRTFDNAGLQLTLRSNTEPHRYVVGRAVLGGVLSFWGVQANATDLLHLVITLQAREADDIEEVYLDDEPVGALDGAGWATGLRWTTVSPDTNVTDTGYTSTGALQTITLSQPAAAGSILIYINGEAQGFPGPVTIVSLAGTALQVTTPQAGIVFDVLYKTGTIIRYVRVRKFLGTESEPEMSDLMAAFPGVWTSAHRGHGLTKIHVTLRRSAHIFPSGLPNIKARIRGIKAYDPRTGGTVWSDNLAIVTGDYYTNQRYGLRYQWADLPVADWQAEANICDELVTLATDGDVLADGSVVGAATPVGEAKAFADWYAAAQPLGLVIKVDGTTYVQPRYRANGVVQTQLEPRVIVDALLAAGTAVRTKVAGRPAIRVAAWRTPLVTLGDDDVRGQVGIEPFAGRRDSFNTVRGKFIDATQLYKEGDFPPVGVPAAVAEDGGVESIDLQLSFVNDRLQAMRVALIRVLQNRQAYTVRVPAKLTGLDIVCGDTWTQNVTMLGLSKVLRARQWGLSADIGVDLVGIEDHAGLYEWTLNGNSIGRFPANSTLPDPAFVPTIDGLAVESGTEHLQVLSDGTIVSRLFVSWDAVTAAGVTAGGRIEVQYAVDDDPFAWRSLPAVQGDETSTYVAPVVDGKQYRVRARAVLDVGRVGEWSTTPWDVAIGKTAAPANVSGLVGTVELFGIHLAWSPVADADLLEYEVRQGASWAGGTVIARPGRATSVDFAIRTAGAYTFWVAARDTTDHYSAVPTSVVVTIAAPGAPTISNAGLQAADYFVEWTPPATAGAFVIVGYEIRTGADFASGTLITRQLGTTYRARATWLGVRQFWVAAFDAAGNYGTAAGTTITVAAPGAPGNFRAQVVDNNVLLFWDAPTVGNLPVDRYEVRRGGVDWAGGTPIGSNGASTFTTYFETAAGTYLYWVAAIDSAGNLGGQASVSVSVNPPPDFTLLTSVNLAFDGTKVNAWVSGLDGKLYAPAKVGSESWATHFSSHSWTTPGAQITAGYPRLFQPSENSGSYEKVTDLGATVTSATIQVSLTATELFGSTLATPTISVSNTSSTGPWTDFAGVSSTLATNFRWVKVRYDFTASGGDDLMRVDQIALKVSVKEQNDGGEITANAADAGGTTVAFNKQFLSVVTITATPQGTSARLAAVDFVSVPNPTSFKVLLFDTSGTRVSGVVRWTARGVA